MRQGRTRGRRAVTGLAALLVVLLALHHPLMGLMPMTLAAGLPSQGMGAAITTSSSAMPLDRAAGVASPAGIQDVSACSGCTMTCPLMNGITPDRTALRSPGAHRGGHTVWPPTATIWATPTSVYAARNLLARSAGSIPDQRTRRAILQVYLL